MKTTTAIKMMIVHLFLFASALTSGYEAYSQTSTFNPKAVAGSGEKITAYAETDRFFWIGTQNGFYQVRKKNKKVVHFTQSNSQLPSNHVTAICAKSDGEVFIGTEKGILRYDRFTFLVVNTENSRIPSDDITALYCDQEDAIWIGTSQNAVTMIRFGSMKNAVNISPASTADFIIGFEKNQASQVILIMESGNRMTINDHNLGTIYSENQVRVSL